MTQFDSFNGIPNTPSSESSPNLNEAYGSKNKKDSGSPKKDSPSLEISKIVPVTGERPRPDDRTSPLDDEVLHAVFVILWEKDPESQGMTVKQLSDYLLEKHPEMNNLSTKLSNLISAKLNAYVKKLEKGEKTLTYALSREWSNSSPRRMVYVYRGILSPDYKKHAQAAAVQLKQQQSSTSKSNGRGNDANGSAKKSSNGVTDISLTGFKNTNNLLGSTTNLGFSLSPEFNIPYSNSPVSAILTPHSTGDVPAETTSAKKRSVSYEKESPQDLNAKKLKLNSLVSKDKSSAESNSRGVNGNTPGPFNSSNTMPAYVTAAAAAPRLSKFSPKNGFKGNSQNSAGIVAAIHKAISTQTPIEKSLNHLGEGTSLVAPDSNPGTHGDADPVTDSWARSIREGFLTQDIETPESLSFEDLEYAFE